MPVRSLASVAEIIFKFLAQASDQFQMRHGHHVANAEAAATMFLICDGPTVSIDLFDLLGN